MTKERQVGRDAAGPGGEAQARSYQQQIAVLTQRPVAPSSEPKARRWRLGGAGRDGASPALDGPVRADALEVLHALDGCVQALGASLASLGALKRPRLLGKVEEEERRVGRAAARLGEARLALEAGDLAGCGKGVAEADRELAFFGGQLTVALNAEIGQASISRPTLASVEANTDRRRLAQQARDHAGSASPRAAVMASAAVHLLTAEGLDLVAGILGEQATTSPRSRRRPAAEGDVRVVPPHELETLADVGGLEEAKDHLRRRVGSVLERSAEATRSGVVHNGILLYGPPGTGKTLLARAVAGEYGLRFIRFSPALVASTYQHEPAKKLRQLFAVAADSVPCLLFLDEVETIGAKREGATSTDQRELVTQLLNSLEEYRSVPGLVIMAATNALDQLDPALREGRFDSRLAIPLPDLEARRAVLEVRLNRTGHPVDWEAIDLAALAIMTSGRSGAALASIVSGAAARALAHDSPLTHDDLLAEVEGRSGQDRAQTVEEQVAWDDVVLPAEVRQRLSEILLVFQKPELGRQLGVQPPAGILLHGPPGTGKTTIAKALATEVKASFYEQSAADLLSKWVGESEQKVAQLFTRARANRPSIIFCDEIDSLLKRRSADSSAPWEERVVSQFLRELDGLHGGEGVLLVGATNRPDIIDDAVRQRRLVPIEIPLPDAAGRARLLEVLCRDVNLGDDVEFSELAAATDGMSGADLKAVRNAAGMKALTRTALASDDGPAAVLRHDFAAALAERGVTLPPARAKGRSTKAKKKPGPTPAP